MLTDTHAGDQRRMHAQWRRDTSRVYGCVPARAPADGLGEASLMHAVAPTVAHAFADTVSDAAVHTAYASTCRLRIFTQSCNNHATTQQPRNNVATMHDWALRGNHMRAHTLEHTHIWEGTRAHAYEPVHIEACARGNKFAHLGIRVRDACVHVRFALTYALSRRILLCFNLLEWFWVSCARRMSPKNVRITNQQC
jgi:hypothetical protein